MKYLICLLFLILAFGSCQNNKNDQSEGRSSVGNNEEKKTNEIELKVSNADVSVFLNQNEKISETLEWKGHDHKRNILVFSERTVDNFSEETVIIDSTVLSDGRKVPVYGTLSMTKSKTIYVRHIIGGGISMTDSVSEVSCVGDIFLQYLTSEVHVTDFDSDRSPEIWIPFISDCMSAVAPVETRMIVYGKNSKCTMFGTIHYEDSKSESLEVPKFPDCIRENELKIKYATNIWTEISKIEIFH